MQSFRKKTRLEILNMDRSSGCDFNFQEDYILNTSLPELYSEFQVSFNNLVRP